MMNTCPFFILVYIFLCHLDGVPLKCHEKELTRSYSYAELTVSGKDLKKCENQKNVCVMDTNDCASIPSHEQDRFLNTSCRYHVLQRSFVCRWIYLNNVKSKTPNSYIFSQRENFKHCPSIFTPVAAFNVNVISKDIVNKIQLVSEAFPVSIKLITQAPTPLITSVNATMTSLNVTWTTGHWHSTKCQMRYKCSTTEQWTVDSLTVPEKEDFQVSHVIDSLQPFSLYSVTVACSGEYGLWSEWSEEFQGMTLEAIPTAPPHVSFYVKPSGNRFQPHRLILIWRALEINEARGVILGYEVTYTPTNQPDLKRTIHTKDQKAVFEVTAQDYNLTVMAYNSAGQSPSTNLQINAGIFQSLPKVRGLWASSEAFSLRIRWETEATNVSEFAIEWFPLDDDASKQWKRLNGSVFSTVLTDSVSGRIKPQTTYNITVYSVYGSLCGLSDTIQASLECGTLLDIDQLQTVNVTKTSVTVQWVWREQSQVINVLQYELVLSGSSEISCKSLVVFPHQRQHSFHNLRTNAKYTVSIYGKTAHSKFLKANVECTTPSLETDEIIKAAVPVALVIVAFSVFSVLSRTVYKDYFFPTIANPGHSLIGHWLLKPPYERETVVNLLKLDDFSVTNQLIEKGLIYLEPKISLDKEGFDENMPKMSLPDNHPNESSDNLNDSMTVPGFSEYVDLPLLHANFEYVENYEGGKVA